MSRPERSETGLFAYREAQALALAGRRRQLPVTLITGFLGAGKTTLLSYILSNKLNLRIAAAVNDFAALNIDSKLVESSANGVVELTNGCMCCQLSSDLQAGVWELLQETDDMRAVDYLVIETSGVTDPASIIKALEARFGKLTRARLDSVVTVVDADALRHALDSGAETSAAQRSQLRCADVVLLNKASLVPPDAMPALRAFVEEQAPGCRVHTCDFSRVPLPELLDVEAPSAVAGAFVTHEAPEQQLFVNSGGSLRRPQELRGVVEDAAGTSTGHMQQDEFVTVAFETPQPLQLARFQDWLTLGLLPVDRAKGFVTFAENRGVRCVFNLSGRRRYEFVEDSRWLSASTSQLVVIGRGLDVEAVEGQLRSLVGDGPLEEAADGAAERALIDADSRFQLLPSDDPAVVLFRLTGHEKFGTSLEELQGIFGIDLDELNDTFVRELNADGGEVFVTFTAIGADHFAVRWALGGERTLASVWDRICERADAVLARDLAAVIRCKCGF